MRHTFKRFTQQEVVGFAYIWFYEADNRSVVMEIGKKLYLFDLEQINFSIVFPGIVSGGVCIVTKQKRTLKSLFTFYNSCVGWQYSQHCN